MLFSSDADGVHPLGIRHGSERRRDDRRAHPRSALDRRKGDRRHAGLRSALLATAAMVLPHHVKPELLNVLLQPTVPSVTMTIDSMAVVPAA